MTLFSRFLLVGAFAATSLTAGTVASDTFDTGLSGWGVVTTPGSPAYPVAATFTPVWNSTGGNPGGDISIKDPDVNSTYFNAPSQYTGNLSATYGGTLNYDIILDMVPDFDESEVVLKGGGLVLAYNIPIPVSMVWSTVSVPLTEGTNWHVDSINGIEPTAAQFQSALANVSSLWIDAEYKFGTVETTSLDNVILSSTASQVPEPASLLLVAIPLAGLLLRRRE